MSLFNNYRELSSKEGTPKQTREPKSKVLRLCSASLSFSHNYLLRLFLRRLTQPSLCRTAWHSLPACLPGIRIGVQRRGLQPLWCINLYHSLLKGSCCISKTVAHVPCLLRFPCIHRAKRQWSRLQPFEKYLRGYWISCHSYPTSIGLYSWSHELFEVFWRCSRSRTA